MADNTPENNNNGNQDPNKGDEKPNTPPEGGKSNEGDGKDPVPYHRFQEVNSELTELRKWRQEQEAKAKKAEEESLTKNQEFEQLANKRKEELEQTQAEIKSLKVRSAVERAAVKAGARDPEVVYKLLSDNSSIDINDKGEVTGIEDAINDLKENNGYLFGESDTPSTFGAGSDPTNSDRKTYPLSWVREKWADMSWLRAEHKELGGMKGEAFLEMLEKENRIDSKH